MCYGLMLGVKMDENKAAMSWSNEETFKFIDLYKKESAIWNPKSPFHKDRSKVQDAWKRLEYAMQIPVSELKKKKETLMTNFRFHYKKILQSISLNEDEVYKPIWIFYQPMESFLKDVYELPSADSDGFEFDDQEEDILNENESSPKKKKDVKKLKLMKRYSNVPELQEVNKDMSNALKTLGDVLKSSKRSNNSSKEDDCDLYGRLLAKRLRKFSETERQEIMYELDGLLLSRSQRPTEIAISSDLSDS